MGDELCNVREKLPIYSKIALAQTDLFLCQICNGLTLTKDDGYWGESYWFPTCYVYAETSPIEWKKMKSKEFCEKYMFDLFGVSDLETLKERVSRCQYNEKMGYHNCFQSAPAILSTITLEEIGSVN